MLRPRIIPILLIRNGGLVKTTRFADDKYVGDPINTVRLFNEKQVDEIVVLDIDATVLGREPDYQMIEDLAGECRMPLCYGGGVKTAAQVKRIISLGVEKVAISSAAIERPGLIGEIAAQVGRQSVVAVIDVKAAGLMRGNEVFTHNGKVRTGLDPLDLARRLVAEGAGEIVINSIDRDGTRTGYDLALIDPIAANITTPLTIVGGANSHDDMMSAIARYGVIGLGAGSLFVFKGRLRAVLVNYPNPEEKQKMYEAGLTMGGHAAP